MKSKTALFTPILAGVVMLLAGFSGRLVSLVNRLSEDAFLSLAIIQLIVYLLPVAFYCRVFSINLVTSLKFRAFSVKKIPPAITFFLLFLAGSLVLKYFGIFLFDGAMVDTPDAVYIANIYSSNRFLTILCFVILPAFLEEIVFRGIILEEYARYGAFSAVMISSLTFAMLHLSLQNFVYYFFMGLVLGSLTWVCDSLLPALVLHLAKSFAYVSISASTANYVRQAGKSALLPYLLIAFFLMLLFLLFSQMEGLYLSRARDEMRQTRKEILRREKERDKAPIAEPKNQKWIPLRDVFLSPTFLAVVALFFLQATKIIH